MSTPIINDQLDGMTEVLEDIKDSIDNLPFAGVPEAVSDWLDDHPEATTTVQDGSITEAKLATALADKIFSTKKYTSLTMDADGGTTGTISVGEYIDVYDVLTIAIYQSDSANNGTRWSTNDTGNYITIREYKAGEQDTYLQLSDVRLKGDKPTIIKITRLPKCLIKEVKNGDEAPVMRIETRLTTDKDYISWVSINADTNKVLKSGAVVEVCFGRVV